MCFSVEAGAVVESALTASAIFGAHLSMAWPNWLARLVSVA